MTRRPSTLDQFLAIGGSDNQSDTMDQTLEPFELGQVISGQVGSAASVTAVVSSIVTMIGLTGITADSVGRFITIFGADNAGNNGTFPIKSTFGSTTITYENAAGVAGDANNGAIMWIERDPYTLEDDINHSRTDRRLIKGTNDWYDSIPTYIRPSATNVEVDTNLANVAYNTLDAHAWIEPRYFEGLSVSSGLSFITVTSAGALEHADGINLLGVPIIDGYDVGNNRAAFVEIADAELDGYGDGSSLLVLNGAFAGNRIFGLTRAGSATSPDSIEVEFRSTSVDDWDLSSSVAYTWEPDQPTLINICYGYRQRLDLFDENAIRATLIKGALRDQTGAGGGSGSGITEGQHEALRHLIHFIDCGPAGGFASGAFHEVLPAGSPFPTSFIWWESVAMLEKIVELTVTRGVGQKPITEVWKMYDTDGSTVLTTVTDSISYSGPFETARARTIV